MINLAAWSQPHRDPPTQSSSDEYLGISYRVVNKLAWHIPHVMAVRIKNALWHDASVLRLHLYCINYFVVGPATVLARLRNGDWIQ